MLPIANKPMLMYGFDHLRATGITDIGIVLGPLHEGIKDALGDGSKFHVKITYIDQPDPKGIAHAVLISKDFLENEPFIVYLGDNLLKESIPKLAEEFIASKPDAMVVLARVKDPGRFGVVKIEDGKITKLVEKPKQFVSDYALAGVYFFQPSVFPVIETLRPSGRNELEITEAIQGLLQRGGLITFHEVSGWWKDTGRPEDILEANQLVLRDLKLLVEGKIENGASVSGNVQVGEGSIVHADTALRGPVIVGENSEIGDGARVGPYTSIGSRVKILGAEIENSIVLDGTVVSCRERITDSIIGKNSRIVSDPTHQSAGRKFVVGESTFVSL